MRRTARFCSDKCRVYFNRGYSLNEVLEDTPVIKRQIVEQKEDSITIAEQTKGKIEEKTYEYCKHDMVKGFCKKGCR